MVARESQMTPSYHISEKTAHKAGCHLLVSKGIVPDRTSVQCLVETNQAHEHDKEQRDIGNE